MELHIPMIDFLSFLHIELVISCLFLTGRSALHRHLLGLFEHSARFREHECGSGLGRRLGGDALTVVGGGGQLAQVATALAV